MKNLPPSLRDIDAAIPEWYNFHHTIGPYNLPHYLTPTSANASILDDILTYCMADPPEPLCTRGSTWSLSKIIQPAQVLLDPTSWDDYNTISDEHWTQAYKDGRGDKVPVLAQAGIQISALNVRLGQMSPPLALQTSGANDGHLLGGCIATGTHGSDLKVGAVHDTVRALYVITGPDQAVLIQPSQRNFEPSLASTLGAVFGYPNTTEIADDDCFDAATVGLGALGFVHSVIFDAVPLYQFVGEMVARKLDDPDIWDALGTLDVTKLSSSHRANPDFFSVVLAPFANTSENGAYAIMLWKEPAQMAYTPPSPGQATLSTDLSRLVSALIGHVDGSIDQALIGAIITQVTATQYKAGLIGPVLPGTQFGPTTLQPGNGCSSEVAVDQKHAVAAARAVVTALQNEGKAGRHLLGGIGIRFVPQTRALLGMNINPMNMYIEFPALQDKNSPAVQKAVWNAMRASKIPFTLHWGQQNDMDASSVHAYFGARVNRWKAARAKILTLPNAHQVFSNPLVKTVGLV